MPVYTTVPNQLMLENNPHGYLWIFFALGGAFVMLALAIWFHWIDIHWWQFNRFDAGVFTFTGFVSWLVAGFIPHTQIRVYGSGQTVIWFEHCLWYRRSGQWSFGDITRIYAQPVHDSDTNALTGYTIVFESPRIKRSLTYSCTVAEATQCLTELSQLIPNKVKLLP